MAVPNKRRYFGNGYENIPIFLVYKNIDNNISSEGPFKQFHEAETVLHNFLLNGICAWVVSYNEREQ